MDGLEEIIKVISTRYGVDITSSSRKGINPMCKGIYGVLAYRITPFVWKDIVAKLGVSTSMMAHYHRNHWDLYGVDNKYTEMYNTIVENCKHIREHYLSEHPAGFTDKDFLEIHIAMLEKNVNDLRYGRMKRKDYVVTTKKIISRLKEIEYETCE